MGEDSATRGSELLSIQLMGVKSGIPVESLIPALQRVFPRKTEAQIREALNRLPILLTRGVKKEQALKVKRFLESNGAVLKIIPSKPPIFSREKTINPHHFILIDHFHQSAIHHLVKLGQA